MSSTSSPTTPPPAPWRTPFLTHLSKMDSPEFVFSSLQPAPQNSPVPHLPRARYCIFRGFWAELPANHHNDAPKNDRVYESDLLTFTTDVRMNKVFELFSSSAGHAGDVRQTLGSGGGGPVEAVWWVKGDVMHQWRVRGEAFIIGPDIEGEAAESSGVRTVKSELGRRMRVVKPEGVAGWSWEREVVGHFGNLSPGMRGSFRAPPPGRPVREGDGGLRVGEKVGGLEDAVARGNFRVVVIKAEEVEDLDLSDPVASRRRVYRFDEGSGGWDEEETWP